MRDERLPFFRGLGAAQRPWAHSTASVLVSVQRKRSGFVDVGVAALAPVSVAPQRKEVQRHA